MSDEQHETQQQINTASALARIEGKLETLSVKVDAGDKHSAQLVELLKERVSTMLKNIEELKTSSIGYQEKAERSLTTVRTDIEKQLAELELDINKKLSVRDEQFTALQNLVTEMRLTWAKAAGIALGAAVASQGVSVVLTSAFGR